MEHSVEYMGKVFFMTDNAAMEKFLRKPEIYGKLKLPHKLPPVAKKMDVFSLPMTGFLEQTVSELVKKALNEVGNYKPKFPFLSPTRSSLLYLAYYLKGMLGVEGSLKFLSGFSVYFLCQLMTSSLADIRPKKKTWVLGLNQDF